MTRFRATAAFAAVSRCCASDRLASPGGVFSIISSRALTAPLKWEHSDKSPARRENDCQTRSTWSEAILTGHARRLLLQDLDRTTQDYKLACQLPSLCCRKRSRFRCVSSYLGVGGVQSCSPQCICNCLSMQALSLVRSSSVCAQNGGKFWRCVSTGANCFAVVLNGSIILLLLLSPVTACAYKLP